MRDINAHGNVYGGIHVHGQQQNHLPYEQCTDEQLAEETERLKGGLSRIRRGRYGRLTTGMAIAFVIGVGGLWALNAVDPAVVGIIGVMAAVLTGYITFRMWAEPRVDEENLADGIELIRQLRSYRGTWEPPRR